MDQEILRLWRSADKSADGTIDLAELANLIAALSDGKLPPRDEVERIFKALDTDNNGVLSFTEFEAAVKDWLTLHPASSTSSAATSSSSASLGKIKGLFATLGSAADPATVASLRFSAEALRLRSVRQTGTTVDGEEDGEERCPQPDLFSRFQPREGTPLTVAGDILAQLPLLVSTLTNGVADVRQWIIAVRAVHRLLLSAAAHHDADAPPSSSSAASVLAAWDGVLQSGAVDALFRFLHPAAARDAGLQQRQPPQAPAMQAIVAPPAAQVGTKRKREERDDDGGASPSSLTADGDGDGEGDYRDTEAYLHQVKRRAGVPSSASAVVLAGSNSSSNSAAASASAPLAAVSTPIYEGGAVYGEYSPSVVSASSLASIVPANPLLSFTSYPLPSSGVQPVADVATARDLWDQLKLEVLECLRTLFLGPAAAAAAACLPPRHPWIPVASHWHPFVFAKSNKLALLLASQEGYARLAISTLLSSNNADVVASAALLLAAMAGDSQDCYLHVVTACGAGVAVLARIRDIAGLQLSLTSTGSTNAASLLTFDALAPLLQAMPVFSAETKTALSRGVGGSGSESAHAVLRALVGTLSAFAAASEGGRFEPTVALLGGADALAVFRLALKADQQEGQEDGNDDAAVTSCAAAAALAGLLASGAQSTATDVATLLWPAILQPAVDALASVVRDNTLEVAPRLASEIAYFDAQLFALAVSPASSANASLAASIKARQDRAVAALQTRVHLTRLCLDALKRTLKALKAVGALPVSLSHLKALSFASADTDAAASASWARFLEIVDESFVAAGNHEAVTQLRDAASLSLADATGAATCRVPSDIYFLFGLRLIELLSTHLLNVASSPIARMAMTPGGAAWGLAASTAHAKRQALEAASAAASAAAAAGASADVAASAALYASGITMAAFSASSSSSAAAGESNAAIPLTDAQAAVASSLRPLVAQSLRFLTGVVAHKAVLKASNALHLVMPPEASSSSSPSSSSLYLSDPMASALANHAGQAALKRASASVGTSSAAAQEGAMLEAANKAADLSARLAAFSLVSAVAKAFPVDLLSLPPVASGSKTFGQRFCEVLSAQTPVADAATDLLLDSAVKSLAGVSFELLLSGVSTLSSLCDAAYQRVAATDGSKPSSAELLMLLSNLGGVKLARALHDILFACYLERAGSEQGRALFFPANPEAFDFVCRDTAAMNYGLFGIPIPRSGHPAFVFGTTAAESVPPLTATFTTPKGINSSCGKTEETARKALEKLHFLSELCTAQASAAKPKDDALLAASAVISAEVLRSYAMMASNDKRILEHVRAAFKAQQSRAANAGLAAVGAAAMPAPPASATNAAGPAAAMEAETANGGPFAKIRDGALNPLQKALASLASKHGPQRLFTFVSPAFYQGIASAIAAAAAAASSSSSSGAAGGASSLASRHVTKDEFFSVAFATGCAAEGDKELLSDLYGLCDVDGDGRTTMLELLVRLCILRAGDDSLQSRLARLADLFDGGVASGSSARDAALDAAELTAFVMAATGWDATTSSALSASLMTRFDLDKSGALSLGELVLAVAGEPQLALSFVRPC